jgi:hypothetical protein
MSDQTKAFSVLHKKKSGAVRTGDHEGQIISPIQVALKNSLQHIHGNSSCMGCGIILLGTIRSECIDSAFQEPESSQAS